MMQSFHTSGVKVNPGIYDNIPNADYHGGAGISNSGLAIIRRSPLHYRARQLAANDNEPTTAQAIGTAFHALLLEPELFYKEYCLGVRQSDFPDAVDSRDQLVAMADAINADREAMMAHAKAISGADELKAMIAKLNEGRLPKLPTTGSKDVLVARIAEAESAQRPEGELQGMNGAELKAIIDELNKSRPGLLSTSGSVAELTATLRAAGAEFVTRKEILDEWLATNGTPMLIDTAGSMSVLAEALRANGKPVQLWTDIKAEWMTNNGHRNVLEPEAWDQLMNMRDAVHAHPKARALLIGKPGVAERSVYWIDEATGELCRCRPDFWRDDDIVVDLKTTEDASEEGFSKSIANWSYDTQDAFYRDGCAAAGRPLRAFVFLAVEKSARVVEGKALGVAVYYLDDAGRELGRAKYRQDLAKYAECKRANVWPCYSDDMQKISLPQWHMNRNAHLVEGVA